MTLENIENRIAYMCQCGGVNFALLKSGAIECNKCSTPLDNVKWWAGGMGAQLARAITAEAERDALKAAMPVGELTDEQIDTIAGGKVDYFDRRVFARAILAAASTQPVREPCWCTTCRPITVEDMRFVVCPDCGNKRCPKAHNHKLTCTNSNEPGQPGSSWENIKPSAHGIK